ncbi:uncharacterized protein PADG_01017 [Paracoccidioides brasiliensis Pb18]|uniref:Uncharacterized protein n=1 Tax=Paracoccidioides brasiliensis (strain Pb18) TaxID=502780 RepID=C1FYZ1_PARBD|nr:uncharacterized protein PADG_01017 [Paracoccidioides brasiliensis Pb18]EEH44728.2 hypothetical protein PADG_01017 [Paracoccidioides brasiliensis Pb18]
MEGGPQFASRGGRDDSETGSRLQQPAYGRDLDLIFCKVTRRMANFQPCGGGCMHGSLKCASGLSRTQFKTVLNKRNQAENKVDKLINTDGSGPSYSQINLIFDLTPPPILDPNSQFRKTQEKAFMQQNRKTAGLTPTFSEEF